MCTPSAAFIRMECCAAWFTKECQRYDIAITMWWFDDWGKTIYFPFHEKQISIFIVTWVNPVSYILLLGTKEKLVIIHAKSIERGCERWARGVSIRRERIEIGIYFFCNHKFDWIFHNSRNTENRQYVLLLVASVRRQQLRIAVIAIYVEEEIKESQLFAHATIQFIRRILLRCQTTQHTWIDSIINFYEFPFNWYDPYLWQQYSSNVFQIGNTRRVWMGWEGIREREKCRTRRNDKRQPHNETTRVCRVDAITHTELKNFLLCVCLIRSTATRWVFVK